MHVDHQVKGTLARLLATENLVIEHKKVSTASFDVVNRVLCLPIWDASGTVYDLLVGHEVGHALFTPAEDWRRSTGVPVPPDYVNVIEDARIEKLMKRKYAGLAKTFYKGYQELNDEDFFGINDVDLEDMSFIDRLNLHFKIGTYARIPFLDEWENSIVSDVESAETFADVLFIAEEIVKHLKAKVKEQEVAPSVQKEGELQEEGQGGESKEWFTDSDPEEDHRADRNADEADLETPSYGKEGAGPDEEISETQRAFDESLEELAKMDNWISETEYVEIPKINLDRVVVPNGALHDHINKTYDTFYADRVKHFGDPFEKADARYNQYRKDAQKEVNYLVKEFEMRKSAAAYARASTARTGVLDTKMLHTYKYNDDLFKKVSVIPEGKNHGLIFILDWSGSMSNCMQPTVEQLLNLAWFCRKVQIPFDVYAFTYEWHDSILWNDDDEVDPEEPIAPKCVPVDGHLDLHKRFSLLNLLTSDTTTKKFEIDCRNLYRLAYNTDRRNWSDFIVPSGLELSGTPLNEAVICLHEIIPQFKKKYGVEKVNAVILSDGESAGISYKVDLSRKYNSDLNYLGNNTVGPRNALRCRKTGNVYKNFDETYQGYVTTVLLKNVKDCFPEVNLIGFRILSGSDFGHLLRGSLNMHRFGDTPEFIAAMKLWRKNKAYEINSLGYDSLYAMSHAKLEENAEFTVSEEASDKDVAKAFRAMMKTKRTNKKILSSFAELVS